LLLPLPTAVVVRGTAGLAGCFAVASGHFTWDGQTAVPPFIGLLPIAARSSAIGKKILAKPTVAACWAIRWIVF